jgi:hypothetical protein
MARYKGRVSARAIERDFPHVVETVVPEGGLGKTLDAMHAFHKRHKIEAHTGKGRRDKNGRDYIRWCFANPDVLYPRKRTCAAQRGMSALCHKRTLRRALGTLEA